MGKDLPVGQRHVDRGVHRAEILLPLGEAIGAHASSRSGRLDAEPAGGLGQADQIVGADLVAEPARAAMDRHQDLALAHAERLRGARVMNLLHHLHLDVMVAGAERAHLAALALLCGRRTRWPVRRLG